MCKYENGHNPWTVRNNLITFHVLIDTTRSSQWTCQMFDFIDPRLTTIKKTTAKKNVFYTKTIFQSRLCTSAESWFIVNIVELLTLYTIPLFALISFFMHLYHRTQNTGSLISAYKVCIPTRPLTIKSENTWSVLQRDFETGFSAYIVFKIL